MGAACYPHSTLIGERNVDGVEDEEVPPTTLCAVCGRPECGGCRVRSVAPRPALPWEQSVSPRALWDTAESSALDPELAFGGLEHGPVARPLVFAAVVECLALGSLAPFLIAVLYAAFPAFTTELLFGYGGASTWPTLVLAIGGLAAVMIALHGMWGVALEFSMLGVAGPWSWNRAWRFAMYSCGWDLLTSPAGLALGSLFVGPRRAASGMWTAAAVPRAAMQAYLQLSRGVPERHCRRVIRQAIWITAVVVLSGAGGLAVGLFVALV